MVGKLEEKLIFQPPKQICPSEKYKLFHGRKCEGNDKENENLKIKYMLLKVRKTNHDRKTALLLWLTG